MTKPLKRTATQLYHYANGERVVGPNPNMSGNCTGLSGNCTDLSGNCTDLRGDCTGLRGNLNDIPAVARPCDLTDWVQE